MTRRHRGPLSMALCSAFFLSSLPAVHSFARSPPLHHHDGQRNVLPSSFQSSPRTPHRTPRRSHRRHASSSSSDTAQTKRLQTLADLANDALQSHGAELFKTLHARVGVVSPPPSNDDFQRRHLRLGLLATTPLKPDEIVASYPLYDSDGSGLALSPSLATKLVYKDILPQGYDGWTGDVGLLAMLLLNEMARLDAKGVDLPRRKPGIQSLAAAWIASLPTLEETKHLHPLHWPEEDQETLQSSSTKKIYRLLDDVEDDSSWLEEKVWSLDRLAFPASVTFRLGEEGEEETRPCFTPEGFRYAVAIVRSRSFFLDGSLRLLPYLDYANHDDDGRELTGGGIGTLWGSAKGALLKCCRGTNAGEEVRISYGPKGAAEYLLDHGFVPEMCRYSDRGASGRVATSSLVTAELSFEIDETDRFRDDKLDVLEYETYEAAPMEPVQVFDVSGTTGEPDPAMIQFLRLVKLGGKDAFLLESIFRKEVWGFMSSPVSEENERLVVNAVIDACQNALSEMEGEVEDDKLATLSQNQQLCAMVRNAERHALERTCIYMKQEAEALDLKEYYQERRLKSLGLDSEWSPENDDVGWGGNRVPGGADYDW